MTLFCARIPRRGPLVGLSLLFGVLVIASGCKGKGNVRVGGACTIDQSCDTGVCIRESKSSGSRAWIGGYCSGNCSVIECPHGTCRVLEDGRSYCLSECTSSKDCRQGYVCSPDAQVCLPNCRLGWSCGSLTCDTDTGACTVPAPTPQPVGSACTLNAGCQGNLCIPESKSSSGTTWTGGTCTQDCVASPECPSGSTCLTFQDGNSRCLTTCSDSTDCRQGYVCSRDAQVCLPDCRLGWSCGSLTCDTGTGACTAPAPTPQPVGSACTLNAGCQGNLCIPETHNASGTAWTAGTCTQDCAASRCPDGATCFAFLDGNRRCLTACSGPTCRQGYVCSSDAQVCLPDCRLGWSCGSLVCNTGTGECEIATTSDAGVGMDTRPANLDSSRDAAPSTSGDAFSPGTGGAGGGGPGGPGGRW